LKKSQRNWLHLNPRHPCCSLRLRTLKNKTRKKKRATRYASKLWKKLSDILWVRSTAKTCLCYFTTSITALQGSVPDGTSQTT